MAFKTYANAKEDLLRHLKEKQPGLTTTYDFSTLLFRFLAMQKLNPNDPSAVSLFELALEDLIREGKIKIEVLGASSDIMAALPRWRFGLNILISIT